MAKKQTRRSISVSKELYTLITAFCKAHEETRSGLIDMVVRNFLNTPGKSAKSIEVYEEYSDDAVEEDEVEAEEFIETPSKPTKSPTKETSSFPKPSVPSLGRIGLGNIKSF